MGNEVYLSTEKRANGAGVQRQGMQSATAGVNENKRSEKEKGRLLAPSLQSRKITAAELLPVLPGQADHDKSGLSRSADFTGLPRQGLLDATAPAHH